MPGIRIRTARREDVAQIHACIHALAAFENILDGFDATEADTEAALFGPSPRVFCDIAEMDGAPAGIALWFYNYSSIRGRHGIYLEDLFVAPEHRGLGIGRALLEHLAARCVSENLARFDWSVLDWNADAIGFYEKLGAVIVGDWRRCRLDGAALAALGSKAGAGAP